MERTDHAPEPVSEAPFPGQAKAWFARAVAELRAGHPCSALAGFEKVLAKQPADCEAALGRGLALHALGEHETALAAFRQTALDNPLAWKAWGSIADITPIENERLLAIERFADELKLCSVHGGV